MHPVHGLPNVQSVVYDIVVASAAVSTAPPRFTWSMVAGRKKKVDLQYFYLPPPSKNSPNQHAEQAVFGDCHCAIGRSKKDSIGYQPKRHSKCAYGELIQP